MGACQGLFKVLTLGASSGHVTNLQQSILETFDIYGRNQQIHLRVVYTGDVELMISLSDVISIPRT
jgi:hypothetical protein